MSESWLSFKLDDKFVKGYEGTRPSFGFGGLGELVFYRTYSRVKESGGKESFAEVIRRCVEGSYTLQKDHILTHKLGWDEKKAQESAQTMYDHMFNMRFLPPGRGLWMMGTEYAHTKTPMGMFNCFAGETEVLTKQGYRPISDIAGTTQTVLTSHGGWVEAPIKSYGKDSLYKLTLTRARKEKEIFVTRNHIWFAKNKASKWTSYGEKTTLQLEPGNYLRSCYSLDSKKNCSSEGLWRVKSVDSTNRVEEVFCAEVDKFKSFVIEGDILTHNCSFISTKDIVSDLSFPFRFLMDVSMLGVGCGFDTKGAGQVTINNPGPDSVSFIIPDSREGWVESVGKLIDSYLLENSPVINFDYSGIRLAGSSIKGFGGVSSGPGHLTSLHENIVEIFEAKLKTDSPVVDSRVIVDIMNLIGECVVAGNIRRCLVGETPVHTDKGKVPIEDIKEGDNVLTSKGYHKVTEHIKQGVQAVMAIETSLGVIECTGSHKVAVFESEGVVFWKNADQLRESDYLVSLDSLEGFSTMKIPVKILSLTYNVREAPTFDISVDQVHEFIAGEGLLVHNSAEIAIGDPMDAQFLNLKNYDLYPERKNFGRYSNNTVDVKLGQSYNRLAERTVTNGEPGYIWLENCQKFGRMIDPPNWRDANVSGTNPCFSGDQRLLVIEDKQEIYRSFQELNGKVVTIYNPITRGTTSGVRVFETGMRETIDICLSNGKRIRCTPDHRFMSSTGKEVEAKDLKGVRLLSGMPCIDDNEEANFPEVLNIVRTGTVEKVYDFSMPNTHWGVVEGVVAHNCGEISLESGETCNLVEIFMPNIANRREFFNVIKYAYLYAKSVTLVTTHIELNNRVQMRNRRIGLSLSGIAMFKESEGVTKMVEWMDEGYHKVQRYDDIYSKWLAIPKSIKTTTVKPSGSVSLVAGTTSGIHYPMGAFYFKNMRLAKDSDGVKWAESCGYKVEEEIKYKEDDQGNWVPYVSDSTSVASIPVRFPIDIRSRTSVSIWEQMKLVELVQKYWADNQVSVTVTFNPGEEEEVSRVLEMFDRDLKTVSFIKNDSSDFPQMPEEAVSESVFEEYVKSINLKPILEFMKEEAAGVLGCTGDSCDLDYPEFEEAEVE